MSIVQKFDEQIANQVMSENYGHSFKQRMYLIELMLYGDAEKLGDVDFTSFTVGELKDTLDDIMSYESDEIHGYETSETINVGNPLLEINRLAGIQNDILKIKPLRMKRRRFF